MFGIDSTEFLLIVIAAVVFIGPKDLPRALYKVGQVMGKARAMARHFRTGMDAMVREVELEELQKQWDKENARIMAAHPMESTEPEKALLDGMADQAQADASVVSDTDQAATGDGAVTQADASEVAPDEVASEAQERPPLPGLSGVQVDEAIALAGGDVPSVPLEPGAALPASKDAAAS
jgi:sec-independent protein translocase protein TatB